MEKYSPAQLAALRQMEALKLEHKLGDEECYLFGLYAIGEQIHVDGECTDPMSFVIGSLESDQVRSSLEEEFQNFVEKMS